MKEYTYHVVYTIDWRNDMYVHILVNKNDVKYIHFFSPILVLKNTSWYKRCKLFLFILIKFPIQTLWTTHYYSDAIILALEDSGTLPTTAVVWMRDVESLMFVVLISLEWTKLLDCSPVCCPRIALAGRSPLPDRD